MTRPDDTKLPVWLRGVPLPEPPPSAVPAAPEEEQAGLPSWLRDLSGSEQVQPVTSLPPAEVLYQPVDQSSEDEGDLPDWLQSLGGTAPDAPSAPPAPSTPEPHLPTPRAPGFTNWLTGEPSPAPTPAVAPASKEDLPVWLREAGSKDQPASSEELPDWLQSLEPKPPTAPADLTVSAPPSWVEGEGPSAKPHEDPPPAWMRDAAPSVDSPASGVTRPAAASDQGVPDWIHATPEADLGRMSGDDLDLGMTPFSLGDAPPAGSASEWLGANASQLMSAGPTPELPSSPAWLSDSQADSPADADQSDLDDLGSDVPTWLREAAGPIPDTNTAPSWTDTSIMLGGMSGSFAEDADDVPTWLRDATPAVVPEVPAPAPAQDGPAWLSSGVGDAPEVPAEDGPAWLSSGVGDAPEVPAEDLPAWMSESASEPSVPPVGAAEQDVPEWLRTPETAAPIPPPSMPIPADNDLPAWMRESTALPPSEPLLAPAAAPSDLPDWLTSTPNLPGSTSSDSLPPWLTDEVGEPLPTSIAPGDAGLPAWLRGTDLDVPPPESPAPKRSGSTTVGDTTQSTATTDSDLLGGADLPAWLRRDTEKPRDANPDEARSLDWLARLGGVDDDMAPVAAEAGPRLRIPSPPIRSGAQIEALALLRSMAANPLPIAAPPVASAPPSALRRIGLDRFLSIVLLLALLAGLATPGLANGLGSPSVTPVVSAFHDQISMLGPEDVVLIGYEWDAQRISELRPLERAVIGQLIAQKVRVVLVSTDPQGALLQFDLRDQLNAAGYQGGGLDYVLLGYRAGGEIGLRQLAQDLRGALRSDFNGNDATIGVLATDPGTGEARISTLDDFAMLLVLADEPTDVQGWMEQIRPATTRQIGFLVPASVGPFAQPYFRLPGVFSLVGTADALAYQQLGGGDVSGATLLQASQLRLASLIFAGLLAISMVGVLLREVALRRRRNA